MKHALVSACLLAALVGPALAETPLPLKPAADCSGLAQTRAQAHAVAAPLHYDVVDLDGDNARAFEQSQDIPAKDQADHLSVMVNRQTGRAAALVNDGPGCAFQSVFMVLSPPYTKPLDAALDALRLAR